MRCLAVLAALVLIGCGGGGGGGSSPAGSTATPGAVPGESGGTTVNNSDIELAPNVLNHTFRESTSTSVTVRMTPKAEFAEPISVVVLDRNGVLSTVTGPSVRQQNDSVEISLPISSGLQVGNHNGQLEVKLCFDNPRVCARQAKGSPISLGYAVAVTPWKAERTVNKLLSTAYAAAFHDVGPDRNVSKQITISDNHNRATAWKASSNQPWLKVTDSGTTGVSNNLSLQADAAGLADNQIHKATITVSATGFNTEPLKVEVGVWKGKASTVTTTNPRILNDPYFGFVMHDTLPAWYQVSTRQEGSRTIELVHSFTNEVLASYIDSTANFQKAVTSGDGRYLYVLDQSKSLIVVLDANTLVRQKTYAVPNTQAYSAIDLVHSKVNGEGIIFLGTGGALRARDGKNLVGGKFNDGFGIDSYPGDHHYLAITENANRIYSGGSKKMTRRLKYWDLDYTEAGEGTLSVRAPVTVPGSQYGDNGFTDAVLLPAENALYAKDGYRVHRRSLNDLAYINYFDCNSSADCAIGATVRNELLVASAKDLTVISANGNKVVKPVAANTRIHVPSGSATSTIPTISYRQTGPYTNDYVYGTLGLR